MVSSVITAARKAHDTTAGKVLQMVGESTDAISAALFFIGQVEVGFRAESNSLRFRASVLYTIEARSNHLPAASLELILKPLRFKLCPIMRHGWAAPGSLHCEVCTLMDVDVTAVEKYFESTPFVGQGGWGISSFERYERCLGTIENWEEIDAPAISLDGAGDGLKIIDGRHRLQALRDSGYTAIKIAVPEAHAARIAEILAIHTRVNH